MNVSKLANYKMSRDYVRLAELMKQASVLCLIDFDTTPNGVRWRDFAKTRYCQESDLTEEYEIISNRILYVLEGSVEKFACRCEERNVEFIVPEEAPEEGIPS
jgi:hypothetical protein